MTRTASILRAYASSSTRLRGELGNQPFAGLIGGGNPGVDGGALSQLKPLGFAVGSAGLEQALDEGRRRTGVELALRPWLG